MHYLAILLLNKIDLFMLIWNCDTHYQTEKIISHLPEINSRTPNV